MGKFQEERTAQKATMAIGPEDVCQLILRKVIETMPWVQAVQVNFAADADYAHVIKILLDIMAVCPLVYLGFACCIASNEQTVVFILIESVMEYTKQVKNKHTKTK